jgi:hypothetical protein
MENVLRAKRQQYLTKTIWGLVILLREAKLQNELRVSVVTPNLRVSAAGHPPAKQQKDGIM